jgi:DNA modification methylase
MTWKLLQGDVLDKLSEIETGTVQTCVTSPPYWNLRNYGIDGQIGLEETPEEYVEKMVQVFREVKRVLRDDGTVWLNLGDSYANANPGSGGQCKLSGAGRNMTEARYTNIKRDVSSLKPKDLVGIPWRVAFALQADGWYLRSDIIWAKPNPMPESVTDRPTKAHEYIFLLSKSKRYFYDAEAIKEMAVSGEDMGVLRSVVHTDGKYVAWHAKSIKDRQDAGVDSKTAGTGFRNKRTVWTIATQPYSGAHFATFPPKLIEPCILAGTSPKACEVCGAPWERVVERQAGVSKECPKTQAAHEARGGTGKPVGTVGKSGSGRIDGYSITTGWQPTCSCKNEGTGRCIVLDPFVGSGTTLWVAERFGRDSIGIELSPEYCELINKRMANRQMTLFERGADL